MPVQTDLREPTGRGEADASPETVRYAILRTKVGDLALAYRDGAVIFSAAVRSGEAPERAIRRRLGSAPVRELSAPPAIERAVHAYLAGQEPFALADLSWLPPFQQQVLAKVAQIPRGEVRTYGWVARAIGAPWAAKDVGAALAENPLLYLIPCHRVVRADGSLGGYAGGGPALKRRLLRLEGAILV